MAVSNTNADSLLLGSDQRGFFLVARGSIRASLCFPLRESLLEQLGKGPAAPAVSADLSQCSYVDSTFIGLLVAVDKRLRKISGARLRLHRPSPACRDLLAQVGLGAYLQIEDSPIELPSRMEVVSSAEQRPAAEFILSAHEALMETSEEARKKFGLLKEMLEKKLRKEKPPQETP